MSGKFFALRIFDIHSLVFLYFLQYSLFASASVISLFFILSEKLIGLFDWKISYFTRFMFALGTVIINFVIDMLCFLNFVL